MIEGKAAEDRGVMAEQSARAADDHLWTIFEAQALPHADRLFRLAMWFEQARAEAEDLVQATKLHAPGSPRFSSTCGATAAGHAPGRFSSKIRTTVWPRWLLFRLRYRSISRTR